MRNQIKASAMDRGSMIRIPLGNAHSARIEVRSIAPDANPIWRFTRCGTRRCGSPLSARVLDGFWRIGGGVATHGRGGSGGGVRGGSDAYVAERLDHLGIVAGVCREIGLAEWLDAQDEQSHERVGVGTATVAMILNGLGFSNRRLYLVPQFFANKPVERLLGAGITAEDLNDDCLGRTLDWLYAHDPTTLFAGLALRARRAFGISARQVHVDTTSFAVTGEYAAQDLEAHTLAVTYGYSRDHRADLKQWMLALATTRQGDVPLFCQALDGNASDKVQPGGGGGGAGRAAACAR